VITVAFAKGDAGLNGHVCGGGWVLERKRVGTALVDIASGIVEWSERRRAGRSNLVTDRINISHSGGEGQGGQGHGDEAQRHVGAGIERTNGAKVPRIEVGCFNECQEAGG